MPVPGRAPRRLLHEFARPARPTRDRLVRLYLWLLTIGVVGGLAAGVAGPMLRHAATVAPVRPVLAGHLFALAVGVLAVAAVARLAGSAGPITVSAPFRFWLVQAPVRRRDLLRPRYFSILAGAAVLMGLIAVPVAMAGSVAVLPVLAAAALGGVTVAGLATWGQAVEAVDRGVHALAALLGSVSLLSFGSLATGIGRTAANLALRPSPAVLAILLILLGSAALAAAWQGFRALDRIEVSALSRAEGAWTAGHAALASLDVFMLSEFIAERRHQAAGPVLSIRLGSSYTRALARIEWVRLRRRPVLLARVAGAAVVWWGCRVILPAPVMAAIAVLAGFLLVLPVATGARQVAAAPGLGDAFAPRDRALTGASIATCLLASALWTALVLPGLPTASALLAGVLTAGLAAAAYRTVTRPPLDYLTAPVPTPFGDLPVDLWRQIFRGTVLLAVIALLASALTG